MACLELIGRIRFLQIRLSRLTMLFIPVICSKNVFPASGRIVSYELSRKASSKGTSSQRQLVVEYDATPSSQTAIRARYGSRPVLNILIHAYQYLIAKFDFDGFRIDTAKHIQPRAVETFGNAIREFAQTLGKRNFFTIGEIYDNEETINRFVDGIAPKRKDSGWTPLLITLFSSKFRRLQNVSETWPNFLAFSSGAKTLKRESHGKPLISSHGEAGKFFVTFLDNHDQYRRFNHPFTPEQQITMGLALLFCLQGIPAVYYGTEQGLTGTVHPDGNLDLFNNESVREALWGKPNAFDKQHRLYLQIKALGRLRESILRSDLAGFISVRSRATAGISATRPVWAAWSRSPAS